MANGNSNTRIFKCLMLITCICSLKLEKEICKYKKRGEQKLLNYSITYSFIFSTPKINKKMFYNIYKDFIKFNFLNPSQTAFKGNIEN